MTNAMLRSLFLMAWIAPAIPVFVWLWFRYYDRQAIKCEELRNEEAARLEDIRTEFLSLLDIVRKPGMSNEVAHKLALMALLVKNREARRKWYRLKYDRRKGFL